MLGAFCASIAALAILKYRNLSPALLLEGEQIEGTGGNAPSTTRTAGGINDWDSACHGFTIDRIGNQSYRSGGL
jgi:hypothetical protein